MGNFFNGPLGLAGFILALQNLARIIGAFDSQDPSDDRKKYLNELLPYVSQIINSNDNRQSAQEEIINPMHHAKFGP